MGKRSAKIKNKSGEVNLCGKWIRFIRSGKYDKRHPKLSQDELITRLQSSGLMMLRSSLSRIETGRRTVTDVEVFYIAKALKVPITFLYEGPTGELPQPEDFTSLVAEEYED